MNAELVTALRSLDALNSWLRAPVEYPRGNPFHKPVYWVKKKAIVTAHEAGIEMAIKRVRVDQKCRACNGTGDYYAWWAEHDTPPQPCNRCAASGVARLCFVETYLYVPGTPIRWHTPSHEWWSSSIGHYIGLPKDWDDYPNWQLYQPAGQWTVHQPGKSLPPDELRAHLMVVAGQWHKEFAFVVGFHHFAPRGCPPGALEYEDWLTPWIEWQLEAMAGKQLAIA